MGKFYAVKKGRRNGIFNTWDECRAQIKGFSGAIYKSFSSYKEAYDFINDNELYKKDDERKKYIKCQVEYDKNVEAFVDGSFSDKYNMYSYGVVILHNNKVIELSGKDNNKENLSMRNVAGELLGAIEAMKWALSNRIKDINIYYDYEGIEKWALGIWKTNKKGTKEYKEFFDSIKAVLNINFIKVKAHSGVIYNEEADRLAKKEFETVYEVKDQNTKRDYSDIFYTIIDEDVKETAKNTCTIVFQGKRISDNKLKKVAKQILKNDKRKVSEINNINIILNFDNRSLEIEIRDVYNEIYKYEIKL